MASPFSRTESCLLQVAGVRAVTMNCFALFGIVWACALQVLLMLLPCCRTSRFNAVGHGELWRQSQTACMSAYRVATCSVFMAAYIGFRV